MSNNAGLALAGIGALALYLVNRKGGDEDVPPAPVPGTGRPVLDVVGAPIISVIEVK